MFGVHPLSPTQRGIAVVEFAIILPVLLLLLLSVAEMGHAMYQFNTLEKAVRDGARYLADHSLNAGVVSPTRVAGETAATQNLVVFGNTSGTDGNGQPATPLLPGLTPADVTVSPAPVLVGTPATRVQVTVTYTYTPIFAVIPTFGLGPDITVATTFNAGITMRGLN